MIAFDATNLMPVAKHIRNHYPDKEIIICADNDQFTEGNPGLTKAKEAANAVNATVIFPKFNSLESRPTDFNDLYQLEGLDCVRKQLSFERVVKSEIFHSPYFSVNEDGVYFLPPEDVSGNLPSPLKICSRLEITARTRDEHGMNHGRLLEFSDPDGKHHQWAMPMDMLAGDGTEYRRILLNRVWKLLPAEKQENNSPITFKVLILRKSPYVLTAQVGTKMCLFFQMNVLEILMKKYYCKPLITISKDLQRLAH